MIESFVASWPLFHNSYLAGWLIAVSLSVIGVVVVARDQIFLGAAVSQASTLGIAASMWLGAWSAGALGSIFESEATLSLMAVLFSLLAALVTSRGGGEGRESHEAITGWVFLISGSLSILIVARSPHGLEEIHRLLASSIIGATREDVWVFGTIAAATASFVALRRRPILLFALDPSMAEAVGMRTRAWALSVALWLGLVVGLSIRVSGALYTFGCLVLPALVAKNVCREVRSMFAAAAAVAIAAAVFGFMLANHYDYPPAQLTVALWGACLPIAWLGRRARR